MGACGHCAPTTPPFVRFGLGVVGVRGVACVNCQSCFSKTEQVRAHCAHHLLGCNLEGRNCVFKGDLSRMQVLKKQPKTNNNVWRGSLFQGCQDRLPKGDGGVL